MGFINEDQLMALAEGYLHNSYGRYLRDLPKRAN
jgi:hypothetical protein